MSLRYAHGYTDPRAVFGLPSLVSVRYGMEYKIMSYTSALAESMKQTREKALNEIFKDVYAKWRRRFGTNDGDDMKVDAHKYETEAGTLDIDVIKNIWTVKYGNDPVSMETIADQDPFTWECGNRLHWAGYLKSEQAPSSFSDYYVLLDKPCR